VKSLPSNYFYQLCCVIDLFFQTPWFLSLFVSLKISLKSKWFYLVAIQCSTINFDFSSYPMYQGELSNIIFLERLTTSHFTTQKMATLGSKSCTIDDVYFNLISKHCLYFASSDSSLRCLTVLENSVWLPFLLQFRIAFLQTHTLLTFAISS